MDFIVIYDKKTRGNPIVAIHSQRFRNQAVTLKDIHPEDDPAERGIVIVPGEILNNRMKRKYKRDKEGNIVQKPVLQERSKDLTSVADASLKQNILIFGEPVAELSTIKDLAGKKVRGTIVDEAKGIIGIGDRSGHFTVVCCVSTGLSEPEVASESPNWKWEYDTDGNVTGMVLLKQPD
jgi:hypothetical protein